jgi:hypothetical protein
VSVGPLGAVRGAWLAPIWGPVGANVIVEGGASLHAFDGRAAPALYGLVAAGLALEL